MSLVISLSSVPPRFPRIGPVLESLVAQAGVHGICLNIPQSYRRFPDWDGDLPRVPSGVEIFRCARDLGPATKVLPTAERFSGQDVRILFCDDDHIYADGWAQSFAALGAAHPGAVIAHCGWQASAYAQSEGKRALQPRAVRRWRLTDLEFQTRFLWQDLTKGRGLTAPPRRVFRRSGYVDVFEGYAGVLAEPAMFDVAFHDIPPVLWGVDDVWLSGMLALRGVPIWLEAGIADPRQAEAERHAPLAKSRIDGADRRNANRIGVEYFQQTHGIWL